MVKFDNQFEIIALKEMGYKGGCSVGLYHPPVKTFPIGKC